MDHRKISKIYVIRSMYLPNSAVNNRMMGHLKAFSKAGIDVEATFIMPNHEGERCKESIVGVFFHYCWGNWKIKNKYIKAILSYWWLWKYIKTIPTGAIVLLLGSDSYMKMMLRRNDLNIYYETTEHPALSRNERQLRTYVNNCQKLKHIFVISRPLRQFFLDRGFSEERVSIINMTVDPQRFEGIEKQKGKERYIAYCGTVSNNKDGVNDLLKAFAITLQSCHDVKLYIIGATPDKEDRAGNMKLIESLHIKDYVVFTGVVSVNNMPQLLKNAAVMALDRPNSLQAQNGFPTKLGEYLLTGNPVVVTKVGDIPFFLKDKVTALLSDDRDAQAFAEKLKWALNNPDEAQIIGGKGREVALRNFNSNSEGIKMMKIIENTK